MDAEAVIVINGVALSPPQSMVVRVAIADLLLQMQDPAALGKDEAGRSIAAGYRARAAEVQELIFREGP